MPFLSRLARALLLASAFVTVAASAYAQPQTPAALRAKKLAARRYAGGVVALPESAFASGLRVCARETPSGINGYWRVPAKIVDAMDAELLIHLRKSGIDKRLAFAPKLYLRQYAGFVKDGVRGVYINALLVEKGSPIFNEAQKAFPKSCEGLAGSFGIQYDTQAKKFTGFSSR